MKGTNVIIISDYLTEGVENARTARELAQLLGVPTRTVTAQIERERGNGAPICADSRNTKGYYLARNATELNAYCERREKRTGVIAKNTRALRRTAKKMLGAYT